MSRSCVPSSEIQACAPLIESRLPPSSTPRLARHRCYLPRPRPRRDRPSPYLISAPGRDRASDLLAHLQSFCDLVIDLYLMNIECIFQIIPDLRPQSLLARLRSAISDAEKSYKRPLPMPRLPHDHEGTPPWLQKSMHITRGIPTKFLSFYTSSIVWPVVPFVLVII
jgi:hypothetical protein